MQAVIDTLLANSKQKKITLGQLPGSALSLATCLLCQKFSKFTLVITKDALSAKMLKAEMMALSKTLKPEIFPGLETLPYDIFSPHQDILSERIRILAALDINKVDILIISIDTLMQRLPPKHFISSQSFYLERGENLDVNAFKEKCLKAGYSKVNQVISHGEFAIRGSIVDVFPMGSDSPFRLDLFDNEIESIRLFDCDSQKSTEKVEKIELLPAREYPLNPDGISHFRQAWRDKFPGNPAKCPIYEQISEQIAPAGIEYYLPLFFKETTTLFEYLNHDANIIFADDIHPPGEHFYQDCLFRYEQKSHDITRPILSPETLFSPVAKIKEKANQFKSFYLSHKKSKYENAPIKPLPDLKINRKNKIPLESLLHFLTKYQDFRFIFCAESEGRQDMLIEHLNSVSINATVVKSIPDFLGFNEKIAITISPLNTGFIDNDNHIIFIPESSLFGQVTTVIKQRRKFDPHIIIRDLTELKINAPIVHLDHGVGRYLGLTHIKTGQIVNEFLILQYANDDKIYVPVTSLELISRYTGGDLEHAPLNRLGSPEWSKARKKAEEKISDVACELLEIYAHRDAKVGQKIENPGDQYQQFVNEFPFAETEDQKQAISDIIKDLTSDKPMDRLICGDVGFGKTEVAMRAAFLSAINNGQVCVLVPTTLLANQHFENFKDRFAHTACKIELISRFRTAKESQQVLNGLENGTVDIVIGTHKLIQKDIQFKNLRLLIIDEEHRFGVKQKEHIKSLRTEVDILSMTATPIPRTLNMAMHDLRDISVIATPPAKRLAVKTFCYQKNKQLVQEAVHREILRGGQVFYLHNSVETITHAAEELQNWLPNAKIDVAHGQMRERQLEKVMSDFYHHRFNVLVCTTIIETGIDIPTANTIIIDRADKFGLAQLHQLRGRVGRSHSQAYAYLLTPADALLSKDAKKRLEAISTHEELGAGFLLATHDLEIRGAGEILGEEQSGSMQTIGFNLYMELLEKAVSDLKKGKTPALSKPTEHGPEIKIPLSTIIPEAYIFDTHTRLVLYKRIANATTTDEINDLQVEMIDRFGLLPESVKNLFKVTRLKQALKKLGVIALSLKEDKGTLTFNESPVVSPETIMKLIQVHSKRFKLKSSNALTFFIDKEQAIFDELFKMLTFFDEK